MFRYLIIILFTIISMIVSLFSQPKLKIENGDTLNFGKVKSTESPAKSKVKLYNVGNDTLKIMSVKPGCGCTTARLDKMIVPPGDFATMSVSLNLPGNPGNIHKTIDIKTNDSTWKNKLYHLIAEITFPLRFFPTPYITFPSLSIGEEQTGKIIITNASDEPIQQKEITVEPDYITLNIKNDDIIKPDSAITVVATIKPKDPGPLVGAIKFKTTHPDVPKFMLPIRGNVIPPDRAPEKDFEKSPKK